MWIIFTTCYDSNCCFFLCNLNSLPPPPPPPPSFYILYPHFILHRTTAVIFYPCSNLRKNISKSVNGSISSCLFLVVIMNGTQRAVLMDSDPSTCVRLDQNDIFPVATSLELQKPYSGEVEVVLSGQRLACRYMHSGLNSSPHWTKWPPFWQTTFSNVLSWMKMLEFR